ncbi:MAG: hypothetical protein EBZ69_04655 [Alphaproteobacteria bacterium]|nr:hypothetical protein [Alphaproteobacteria bacterium]NDG05403.1 hypothetical protein [Alphaproteobacteria bacterium]
MKKRLGTDDAATLATVMIENLSAENYADRERKLSGVRVLPQERRMVPTKDGREVDQFPTLMAFWRSAEGPFGQFAPDQWLPAFQEISALAPRT